MNFIKDIETGKIKVNQIGILKAICIIMISFIIEGVGIGIYSLVKSGNTTLYGNVIVEILVKYFSVIAILKLFSEKSNEETNYRKIKLKQLIFIIFIIIGFRLCYEYSIGSFANKLEMNPLVEKAFQELASSPLVFIISVAVIAPVFEEVLFRGIILNGMAKALNEKVAIVISAFLFALMHMNLVQGINAFLLGIILGTIYLKTKSIYLSIFAHLINNTVGILVSAYIESLNLGNHFLFQFAVTLIGIIIMIAGFRIFNRELNMED